ncbi:hypothetical protein, variant [Aphanomyces invadans]|nr:hypothetical protein, variant [Aphanomyces invadans]ETW00678.1 hypothetical protein, variant [Aphanomyces invadans]|eukprot:XP_008870813.1 hypothetical protein, variant [Aphanomyces invadans]
MELIARSEDKPMQLSVYNIKSQTTRELSLTPSRNWPGKGMLGVTIRFDSFDGVEDHLLHVLEVAKKSPADIATLEPNADYLLGTPERVFRDPEDLYDEIIDHLDQPFQCYVYNARTDQVRLVRITPHDRWGGEGYLGAEVGHGYLHRLPASVHSTVGESVGFVSISNHAKAATDYFAPPAPPAAPVPSAAPETTATEEVARPTLFAAGDAPTIPSTEEPRATTDMSAPSEVGLEEAPAARDAHTIVEPTQEVQPPTAPRVVTPPKSAAKPAYPPPVGGGIGFPISTVATYIDPTSPKASS